MCAKTACVYFLEKYKYDVILIVNTAESKTCDAGINATLLKWKDSRFLYKYHSMKMTKGPNRIRGLCIKI